MRVALITLDGHLSSAAERAFSRLRRTAPGLECSLHCAGEWSGNPDSLAACQQAIDNADVVIACMLFVEEHIKAVMPHLEARRDHCDAMLCFISAAEIIRLTRIGGLDMSAPQKGPLALLKKLRGGKNKDQSSSNGEKQLRMLKRLPRILRFIPGKAQDLRVYFLAMQYWLAGSEDNIRNLVALVVSHYADGPRKGLREALNTESPAEYPDVGLYHPQTKKGIVEQVSDLPKAPKDCVGTVGVLLMRSYVLSGNTRHYDAVIQALEDRGLRVIPAFAGGLDARPAVKKYFHQGNGEAAIDALISLTGFSLVGGPAYNDARAAEELLARLDVPYTAAHATEFQTLEDWGESEQGLLPVETTIMVAIPELDGAASPTLFGGRSRAAEPDRTRDMHPHPERAERLAARVARKVQLRRKERAQRKIAVVLFNFPPNAGAVGTAAYLAVFRSVHNTLRKLAAEGYTVDVPETVDELRERILEGNAKQYGADANVCHRIDVDHHVRTLPWLEAIEKAWGPAPGKHQTDGRSIHVLGAEFGNVLVGIQPAFGYEGDPMRLLFDRGLAPTHAFAAFYQYLRKTWQADAVLHFGTHGALEFMPGKQCGMSADCWPDRLIGDLPNFYLYAANNPSEGTVAKRRSGATLVSYLTPPLTQAGLYNDLADLQGSIDRWRGLEPEAEVERRELEDLIQAQAAAIELAPSEPAWNDAAPEEIDALRTRLDELRQTLIPEGLHVVGEPPNREQRVDWLAAVASEDEALAEDRARLEALADGTTAAVVRRSDDDDDRFALLERMERFNRALSEEAELPAIVRALDGGFIRPVAGGDLLRNPDTLPTGRNLHGFDPFRIPSAYAMKTGEDQARELLERISADSGKLPESVAVVLWGSDNLKNEGQPIAQALHLMGARPRTDSYGRLCGAELIPLETLGRPRIDVIITLSGIFRDLLPDQTRLLAEAAWLAASADEPADMNFVRAHALDYQARHDCDLETAALRVFSNASGAYGSNVNQLVDAGTWEDGDELAEQYSRRKCFAYGRSGPPRREAELLQDSLSHVGHAYQNLESAELGVTTIDHYFDTLGGISRAAKRVRGEAVEVYIGDQTRGGNTIRTLEDQVALETRTRLLNPRWYEGLLQHGYEGVKQLDTHVANTMGWSATTTKVAPWVYQRLTETFVLDEAMRKRLAELNPAASARVAQRLIEASERNYWQPDDETLEQLERAGEELEDRLEGITESAAA
jgi:magnesium chelatase subunit H